MVVSQIPFVKRYSYIFSYVTILEFIFGVILNFYPVRASTKFKMYIITENPVLLITKFTIIHFKFKVFIESHLKQLRINNLIKICQ